MADTYGVRSIPLSRILSILVCRFMLRLRSVYLPADPLDGTSQNDLPSMVFANIGAPLSVDDLGTVETEDHGEDSEDDVIVISADPLGSIQAL